MKDKEEFKQKILEYLKKNPSSSISKIAFIFGLNYYKALLLIEELEKEKKVVRIQDKRWVYWKIKE